MSSEGAERAARRIAETILRKELSPDWITHMAAIISEETGTQWTSVSTKLPDDGVTVLGVYLGRDRKYREIVLCYHNISAGEKCGWVVEKSEPKWLDPTVTHWQPLPAAPDGGATKGEGHNE